MAPIAALVVLLMLATGCASTSLVPYKPQPIDDYKNVQTKNGLAIAVDSKLDDQGGAKHFGVDLAAANVIPVYVIAENRHPSLNIVLLRERILLVSEQFEIAPTREKVASTPGRTGTGVGLGDPGIMATYPPVLIGMLVAAPFMLISAHRQRNKEELAYRLSSQEFHSRTLAPGQSAAGFVYFQVPKDARLTTQWFIRLEGSTADSEEVTRFEFRFAAEADRR
jgi:hypothetical protein